MAGILRCLSRKSRSSGCPLLPLLPPTSSPPEQNRLGWGTLESLNDARCLARANRPEITIRGHTYSRERRKQNDPDAAAQPRIAFLQCAVHLSAFRGSVASWLQNPLIDWRSASVSDRNSKPCWRSNWLRTSAKTLRGVAWHGSANSSCTMLPTAIDSGRVAPSPPSAMTKQCPTWVRCWRSRTRTGKLVRYRVKRRRFACSCRPPVWADSRTLVDVNGVFIVESQ